MNASEIHIPPGFSYNGVRIIHDQCGTGKELTRRYDYRDQEEINRKVARHRCPIIEVDERGKKILVEYAEW